MITIDTPTDSSSSSLLDTRSTHNAIARELARAGYCHIKGLFTEAGVQQISRECEQLELLHYTKENLDAKRVYPSDKTDARVSHAMMVTDGNPTLPHINILGYKYIADFITKFRDVTSISSGRNMRADARFLLNWQTYHTASKPVFTHFDGEYFGFSVNEELQKIEITEAVVPEFVMLLTVYNEGDISKDVTVLVDPLSDLEITPAAGAGDIVIFNNTRFMHRVGSVSARRRVVGIRCFDDASFHFVQSMHLSIDAVKDSSMPDVGSYTPSKLGGYIAPLIDSQEFLRSRLQLLNRNSKKVPF